MDLAGAAFFVTAFCCAALLKETIRIKQNATALNTGFTLEEPICMRFNFIITYEFIIITRHGNAKAPWLLSFAKWALVSVVYGAAADFKRDALLLLSVLWAFEKVAAFYL
jgi:hypothetical protein